MTRTLGQATGGHLEDNVRRACEYYLDRRIARLDKVSTPIVQVGRMGPDHTFKARYAADAHVDFIGVWLEAAPAALQGKAIGIECKATLKANLPLSRIEPQQRAWLDDIHFAYVLVHFVAMGTTRLVPWHTLPAGATRITVLDGWACSAALALEPQLRQLERS